MTASSFNVVLNLFYNWFTRKKWSNL